MQRNQLGRRRGAFRERVTRLAETLVQKKQAQLRNRLVRPPPVTRKKTTRRMRPPAGTLKEATQRFQREFILNALRARAFEERWNISATSRDLGVARSQLSRFIEILDLPRSPRDI